MLASPLCRSTASASASLRIASPMGSGAPVVYLLLSMLHVRLEWHVRVVARRVARLAVREERHLGYERAEELAYA